MPNRPPRKVYPLPRLEFDDSSGGVSQEIDFLVDLLDLKTKDHILDVASGPGWHALELGRRGFKKVCALDLSDQLLAIGRQSAESNDIDVRFEKGDPRKANFKEEFDAALILGGGAFGLMETDHENQAILDATFQALKPGGRVAVSGMSLLWLIRSSKDLSGYDPLTGYLTTSESIEVEGSGSESFPLHERYYVFPGLARQMDSAGFRNIMGFGAAPGRYSSRSISVEDPELLLYGIRPKPRG